MNHNSPVIIPQSDPKAGYLEYREEIDSAVQRVLQSGWYILGAEVHKFEEEFANYVGVPNAIGVGNGTDALQLALRACGIGQGDLVFTVSHTAVATVAAIELAGATPVFVDIDPVTYTMSPDSLASVLANPLKGIPKAVIPVHIYGCPVDMPAIVKLARKHGLAVIEDCAQSHGSRLDGKMTGTWGDIAAFSFYPTKNLGAFGDGGAVVTDKPDLAERVRLLQQYGWKQRYVSSIAGGNSRLDELQAAMLRVKLRHLDNDNSRRAKIAGQYTEHLADCGLGLPVLRPGTTHAFHQYVVRTPEREALAEHLKKHQIGTIVHYPVPVHLQPAYHGRLKGDSLPNTEKAAKEILSLPMFPQLDNANVRSVYDAIKQFFKVPGAK